MFGLCTYPGTICCNLIDTSRSKRICTYHLDIDCLTKKIGTIRKKERHECERCPEPVKPGYIYCEFHVIYKNKKTLEQKHKRIEQGRCRSCGGPLHKMGKGSNVTCVNCNDKRIERQSFY
jgi:hypothetical protein